MRQNDKQLPSVVRPWLKHYSEATLKTVIPSCTLYDYLLECNQDYPDDVAILYQTVKVTYASLFLEIDRCARSLSALGVRRNDIVTLALPSIPEVLYLVFALNRIGAVANMIHPLASAEDTCHYLNEVGSKYFFMFTGTYAIMQHHLGRTHVEKAVVVSPAQALSPVIRWLYDMKNRKERVKDSASVMTWTTFIRRGQGADLPPSQRADGDWAIISHTGGTTGQPKGCVATNSNILANIFVQIADRPHQRQECMMATLPPFINYSLVNAMIEPLFCGFKTLLIPRYEPQKFVEYVNRYKVNHVYSIPSYWTALLSIPHIEDNDFSRFGFLVSGGEKLEVAVEREVNRIVRAGGSPVDLIKGTGMTEMVSGATATYPWCNPEGSVGIPGFMTNCRVVDVQTGEELSYNEEGELCFSGPTVMVGYYNNPEATADIIKTDADGTRWLHTGDVGYITEDGVVFITGRIKRLIMQKDNNGMVSKIFPERIESIISQMSAIEECCVVGKPHPDRISLPVAYVVLTPGTRQEGGAIAQAVVDWCRDRLPAYMVPVEVHVLDVMPRTDRGKIDYRSLEERSATTEK